MPRTQANRSFLHAATMGKAQMVRDQVERATHMAEDALRLPNQVRYRFDNALAKGTGPVLLLLSGITFGFVLIAALIITALRSAFVANGENGFFEIFWQTGLRALDPGTMAGDEGWGIRLLSLAVTLAGILIAGTLIGIIATGLETRLDNLRKGKSLVAESDHVLILGWTDRGLVLIDQLALVNSMRAKPSNIVVLSSVPKVELEDIIRERVDMRGLRLAVRRGDPSSALDLARVNVQGARSIVILGDHEPGDAMAITTVLAVRARRRGLQEIPIVLDLSEPDTPAAIERGFHGEVSTVTASRIVARLAAFSLREPGMSQVMLELMNFAGSELYIRPVEGVEGLRYAEAISGFPRASLIGIARADGTHELNPAPDHEFGPGDRPILIAGNESRIKFESSEPLMRSTATPLEPRYNRHEHILVLGWSELGVSMLEELDKFVSPTSTATVLFNERILPVIDVEMPTTDNLQVSLLPTRQQAQTVSDLIATHDYTSVVILAYRCLNDPQRADARSLLSLLLAREELHRTERSSRPSVIVELRDGTNVELAALSGADDYVVSDALASQVMSQLAENPERQQVFEQLYAPKRATVVFRSAKRLGLEGTVSFADVRAAAFAAGGSAIGWRQTSQGDLDVKLNPPGAELIDLRPTDEVVAIV